MVVNLIFKLSLCCVMVLIVCCDGLTGFPEAIGATWPEATVQTCVVHLLRASMRLVGYQDRKFENQWQQFTPFLAFPPAVRR